MAVKRLMAIITMTSSLFVLLLRVPATSARYLSGRATKTQAGMMPMDGVSPVPTEAPGLNGIPKELRRRAIQDFIETAPQNWCGMIDGDYQRIVSCEPNISCILNRNFYITCDFDYDLPTICLDYETYQLDTWIGYLTAVCANPLSPYCITVTSSGLSPQFGCTTTNFPRIHSFVPVTAYYSSLNATRPKTLSTASPAKASNTTITDLRIPVPTSDNNSYPTGRKKPKLPSYAKTGIGSNAGLAALAVIAVIVIGLRQKRRRVPTYDGAGPVKAELNNSPKGYYSATQPVQQEYQPQPRGYKSASQPVQHYPPQLGNTKFPDSADLPPYSPAPVYTGGCQHISVAPIPSDKPTTKIASNYPSSTVTPALIQPLLTNA